MVTLISEVAVNAIVLTAVCVFIALIIFFKYILPHIPRKNKKNKGGGSCCH
jgi:hypothetical protein